MKILKLKTNLVSVITIALIILLVSSNLFVFNVAAKLEYYPDEGLYFDDFSDEVDVTNTSCVYDADRGYFYLDEGTPVYNYDYTSIEMWGSDWSFLSEDTITGALSRFLNPDSFQKEEKISEKVKSEKLSAADNETIDTYSSYLGLKEYTQHPVHRFRVKIDQDISNIEKLTINWWFGDYQITDKIDNLKEISMYIWAHNAIIPRWITRSELNVLYSNTTIGKEDGGEKLPDIVYTGDGKYISEEGYLDFLVIGKPVNYLYQFKLLTDYISVSVETTYGYLTSGSLISSVIKPNNLGGWERVIWSSSRYSDRSGVTISVLDEAGNEIKGYSGKTSPLDISGITNETIRLKATLHSKDPKVTPYIFSWGVLYQKDLEFKDNFSNDYRIEETLGTKIEDNKVVVSTYYSEWPFFGKDSDNTRSYQGPDIQSSAAKIYWYSKENTIAGGFRAPVTSEGRIYVASADKKIYAYDMLKDKNKDTQDYIAVSKELSLAVESSLGIYEDYLIAATGQAGGKNKIYALNKNNLSEELWDTPYPSTGETICFSSNPTIYEDRLFITSWGGNIWDTAYFSFISRFIGRSNKLIGIDITTGDELWKPVKLPVGSISSPAVGNGFVYVGCQNMSGASLFAFDIENGEEIWRANLGIIGRSSPVYADGKVFVLSNEKQNISSPGKYMLTAVDANNGKTIWNMSLGEFKISSLVNIFKGMTFTYKLIEGFAPISTPAYKDGTLFVLSPNGTFLALDANNNGTIKWSYDIKNPLIDLSYYLTSPVVVGDMVYIISGDSNLYAFKTDYSGAVEPAWKIKVGIPSWGRELLDVEPTDVLASPIISDNVIIVSTTDNTINLTGKIICIGNYVQNSQGTVKSTSIHVPAGKWWNKFNADITNSTNNTVTFKILDKDDNPLTDWFNLSDNGYNISGLKSNAIKLYAKLNNMDKDEDKATIKSWTISWVDEKAAPVFDNSSFRAGDSGGVEGWVNVDLTECSIEVEDKAYNNILSGLDIDSARYKLGYIEKNTDKSKISDWIPATSSASSGVTKARIVADLQEHGLNVKDYVNITFTIKDLAGNQAYSRLITFKTDVIKPESDILNKDDFKSSYNNLVLVKAEAEDNTGPADSVSGIRYVSLMYQYSRDKTAGSWSSWKYYGENLTPAIYSWTFGENLESGYYKIITIALDNASNREKVETNKIVEFFFDNTDPIINNTFDKSYRFTEIPSFTLELYDDYSLESLYYRLDNEIDWTELKDDIKGKQTASVKWSLPDDKWADFIEGQERHIYFKLEDTAGNDYETTEDNTPKVIKDENISQLYVDLTDFSTFKLGDTYTIKANMPSDISVDTAKLFYQYSTDNKNWSEVKQVGDDITSAPFEWKFTAAHGNGYYKFYTKVIDTSGAEYTSASEVINVTLTPIAALLLLIALAVIFVLITIFVVKKMKKQKNQ